MSTKGTDQLSEVNAGNITKCIITSNESGSAFDLRAGIAELNYFESVLSNTITATLVIVDTGFRADGSTGKSLIDGLPIRGGERVDLTFSDANNPQNTINAVLFVNRVRNAKPEAQKELYILDLVTQEYLSNELTRVTKRYQGKISENIKSILSDVLKNQS
jgi:hypothetical protein